MGRVAPPVAECQVLEPVPDVSLQHHQQGVGASPECVEAETAETRESQQRVHSQMVGTLGNP